MTAPNAADPTAKTVRLVHAAMVIGALLFAVVLYSHTGAQITMVVAAVILALFVALNPAYLERRR